MEEIDSKASFGRRLKRFREESGYTQSILANILGVERSTYTYYETGKTTPVIFDLMRLCRLYRISFQSKSAIAKGFSYSICTFRGF